MSSWRPPKGKDLDILLDGINVYGKFRCEHNWSRDGALRGTVCVECGLFVSDKKVRKIGR